RTEPQVLVSTKFPSYNFDVIQGDIRYAIDVTKPFGERIVDLRHAGEPVDADEPFIVVTNNYRAYGGGHFPGLDGGNIVVDAAVGNREVLIDWLREHPHLDRTRNGADRSWRFVPVETAGPVILEGAAGKLGVARAAGLDFVHLLEDHGDGTATYAIDLGAAH